MANDQAYTQASELTRGPLRDDGGSNDTDRASSSGRSTSKDGEGWRRQCRRILFFGKSMSRTRCTGGLVDALQSHGASVEWMNMATLRRWFGTKASFGLARRKFRKFRPDLVFVFCRDLPLELVQEFSGDARIVLWIEEAFVDRRHVDYLRSADLVCMSNPTHAPWLAEHGVDQVAFLMSGFSARYHRPWTEPVEPVRDVAFIGGPGRKGQRAEVLSRLAEAGIDCHVFGDGWKSGAHNLSSCLTLHGPVSSKQYRKVCATSRIVLGMNEVNDHRLYFSNRTWLTMACRGFHLTHYVPGLEDLFTPGEHLIWFHDADDALAQVRDWLARPEDRARVAAAGCELVHNSHRYADRVEGALSRLYDTPRRLLVRARDVRIPRPPETSKSPTATDGSRKLSPSSAHD